MTKEVVRKLDDTVAELRALIEPAKVMIWDLAEDFFVWDLPQKHADVILYDYDYAAVRARIAEDYILKMENTIKYLSEISAEIKRTIP